MPSARATPTLFQKEIGAAGRVVAFLPGLGLTTRYWEAHVVPLAASHQLMLIDLLGFGASPKPWTTYTVDRHVSELHRVLRGRERVTLVGHSLGAILALAYAARHRNQLNGLALIGLPCFANQREAMRFFRRRASPERWVTTNVLVAALACVLTRRFMSRALPRLLPDLPREVLEDYVQHTWRSATSTVWEVIYHHNVARDADRIAAGLPVMLLHGEHDASAPLAGVEALTRTHPGWWLRVLPGGDHHPLLRDPAWTLNGIQTLLAAAAATDREMRTVIFDSRRL